MTSAGPSPSPIEELARKCRADAVSIIGRHKKHASLDLYRVLAGCMELCERSQLDPQERDDLAKLFSQQEKGERNRRYVEAGSDIYVLVCRYVFHNETHRANASRYSHCLREAAKLQLGNQNLVGFLKTKGGLNALYLLRPLERKDVSTRCLRLSESVTCPKCGPFTLTLERLPENVFRVIANGAPS